MRAPVERVVQPPKLLRIDANLLIPGRGEPIVNASLVACEGKIEFVGESLPDRYAGLTPICVPVLMPGMWDCHLHYFGTDKYSIGDVSKTAQVLAGARGARDIAATLNAGITSVREMGGYGTLLSQTIREEWLPGPNIYSAVSILSPTAGHADAQELPLNYLEQKMRQENGLPFYTCDGVDDCIKAVRVMVRRGARVIKVATTGGVASRDDPQTQHFSPNELKAIVAEAERSNLAVAAHAHGTKGIHAALEAGCTTIEHGSYLDAAAIEFMRCHGIILVATRSVFEFGIKHPEAWSEDSYAKLVAVNEANKRSYAAAVKAGVRIALGTDLGVSVKHTPFNHGMNGSEFVYAVDAGLTPLQAIEAGTAMGPETLGIYQSSQILSGQLKKGYDADMIALTEDPLQDITVLEKPSSIIYVWKGRKLYKEPGKSVNVLE